MSKNKPRHSLTDLVSQFALGNLEPQAEPASKQKTKRKKTAPTQEEEDLLEKLKKQVPSKTRITLDLDPETYEQLSQLAEYTGQTKAKLLRALIREVAKLLQN
ncbi:ribbon-helix-helix domain-containing protein [Trichocoleus sp. DQ-A3]|uniref:ribbon-helix-helix protein, CopG family n=1 Tax=Cyanophyceae TaxID=3028117 RepID=UPI0016899DD6|nr:ribbon-helix-helix protein, CopG family [Coleofasciculus sp. FACHB-125]